MRKSAVGLCLLCACGLLSIAGCGKKERGISVVVRDGLEAEGMRAVAEAWEQESAVRVNLVTLGRDGYEDHVIDDLSEKTPDYDVAFLPGTRVPELAQKGLLTDLSRLVGWDDGDLLFPTRWGGGVYGLPCDVSTFLLFYRDDIVVSAPRLWSDLEAALPSWQALCGSNVVPFVFAGMPGEELPKIFYHFLWTYGGAIVQGGNVKLGDEASIKAAEFYRDLARRPEVPRELTGWGVIRILDEWRAGRVAATGPQWNALYPIIIAQDDSIARHTKICGLPGVINDKGDTTSVNFCHTWVLSAPSRARHNEYAEDFIEYATGREGARLYARTARGNPARRSILMDSELQAIRPEFPIMLHELEHAQAEPNVPYYKDMHEIMNRHLERLLSGAESAEVAMKQAGAELRELVSRRTSAK